MNGRWEGRGGGVKGRGEGEKDFTISPHISSLPCIVLAGGIVINYIF